jgi:hypothetical protein
MSLFIKKLMTADPVCGTFTIVDSRLLIAMNLASG